MLVSVLDSSDDLDMLKAYTKLVGVHYSFVLTSSSATQRKKNIFIFHLWVNSSWSKYAFSAFTYLASTHSTPC